MPVSIKRLRGYLTEQANVHKPYKLLADFYRFQAKAAKRVSVTAVETIDGLSAYLTDAQAKLKSPPEPKWCYDNALQLSLATLVDPDPISYVEGYWITDDSFLGGHAWNCWHGRHFDITAPLMRAEAKKRRVSQLRHVYFQTTVLDPAKALGASLFKHNPPLQIADYLRMRKLPPDALDVGWNIVSGAVML